MTGTDFDSIVKNRADERVKARIKVFREAIKIAFKNLTGCSYVGSNNSETETSDKANWAVLTGMVEKGSVDKLKEWPHYLWATERDAVRSELLATMDEMQKALLAPKPAATENDDRPATEPEV